MVMKSNAIITIALVASLLAGAECTQSNSQPPASNNNPAPIPTPSGLEERRLALEGERLKLERDKFEEEKYRENKKLEQESTKAWLTAGSLVVPLLAALFTLSYSIWSFRRQLKENAIQQMEAAKLQFEIKAADIAFSGMTPEAVRNRAAVLKKMFGDRLPENFPPPFDPKEHGGGIETSEEKLIFIKLITEHPDKKEEIVRLWDALFGDKWLERVQPLIGKPEVSEHQGNQGIATQDVVKDEVITQTKVEDVAPVVSSSHIANSQQPSQASIEQQRGQLTPDIHQAQEQPIKSVNNETPEPEFKEI
jgi:hypothetical protein